MITVCLGLLAAFLPLSTTVGGVGFDVSQITNNSFVDLNPQINNNGQIVWWDGWDGGIFYWDARVGGDPTQITNGTGVRPQINDNGQVVWFIPGIYYWDANLGGTPTKISNDNGYGVYPQINNNGQVVWQKDYNKSDIYYWDARVGGTPTKINNDSSIGCRVQINDNGQIVWDNYNDIYYWDARIGGDPIQITNDSYKHYTPQINDNGQIVWEGHLVGENLYGRGGTSEIYYWDARVGGDPIQITNDNYRDKTPQINNNGQVVWEGQIGYTSDYSKICYWDARVGGTPTIITNITNTTLQYPQINNNGQIVWTGGSGVYYWDARVGGDIIKVSNTSGLDEDPQINDNGQIVWSGHPRQVDLSYKPTPEIYFAINTHTITASAGANGAISPSGAVNVKNGANQTFTITPAANCYVANVLVDGVSVGAATSYTFANVTTTHTIAASFAVYTHTITASAGSGGSISPVGSVVVNRGASKTFTITPAANYHVADVLVDGASVGAKTSHTFANVTANHTIAANFAVDTRTITASAGPNGTISPSGAVSVNYGSNQTFTITPSTGYHVADVLVDGVFVGAVTSYTFTNVTANHTIAASIGINPPNTITATAGANGSISPSGAVSVNSGANQTFTITPAANYHVADVLVDGASVGAVTTYTFTNVTATHTIAASFAIDKPVANFTANPTQGPVPLKVQFTDTSTGTPLAPIKSWAWSFGDGKTSKSQNPSYTYKKPGIYTATLTVTSPSGSSNKSTTITVIAPPVAQFTATPSSGQAPHAVQFTNTSIGTDTGPIKSWAWSFGDGGTSTEQSPSHTYNKPGTYKAKLTVTSAWGSSSKTAAIKVTKPPKPVASFTATPLTGPAPLTVQFSDTSTSIHVQIASWAWSFGDGGTSTEQSPSHTYNKPGTYKAKLTVTSAGGSSSKTASIAVK